MTMSTALRAKVCNSIVFSGVLLAQFLRLDAAIAQSTAHESSSAGMVIETVARRRVVIPSNEGAQVEFVPADQLHIGDEIFYTMRVRNTTGEPIAKAVVVKAVPRNTEYVADSAVGPATSIEFSIDGGATFAAPDALDIATLPGNSRRATASDYTHMRWQLRHPLAPGAAALLRFRCVFK